MEGVRKSHPVWLTSTAPVVESILRNLNYRVSMNKVNQKPKLNSMNFKCPYCGVLAQQNWKNSRGIIDWFTNSIEHYYLNYRRRVSSTVQEIIENFILSYVSELQNDRNNFLSEEFNFSICQNCECTTVWYKKDFVFPRQFPVDQPNEDLDEKIKDLYREAATIFQDSPRAAAALLRVSIELLFKQLGQKGSLKDCIDELKEKGLSSKIIDALDICRLIGNHAVHPSRIDLEEEPDKVKFIFSLVNDIAEELVTKPRKMAENYGDLLNE